MIPSCLRDIDIELFSFNVRGLADKIKRGIIFRHLKKKSQRGIFLLQETHSTAAVENEWKREWGGLIHFSHLRSDCCGTAVLFSPGLDIKVNDLETNDKGRTQYIKLNVNENEDILLCNIYAPTRNKVDKQLVFL